MRKKIIQCDFMVAGAGYAGICAAVQAGRLGMRTVLAEKCMLLGGNGGPNLGVGATAALTTNPFWNETGIVEEMEQRTGFWRARTHPTSFGYNINPQWDSTIDKMLEEAGVTVLRAHIAIDASVSKGKITAVELLNTENLDRVTVEAHFYLDDTGDAFLAALSGAETVMGRESARDTGERSAPETADEMVSAASVTALVADVGAETPFVPPENTPKWNPSKPCNHFDPSKKIHFIWQVDEGGEDPSNHSFYTPQQLYKRLMYRVYSTWNYLKNEKYRDELKNHALIWISPMLGRREGRRIVGDYLLTQADIESGKTFEDAAGFGGHFLDEHLPSRDGGYEVRFYNRPIPFDIPLRCLYSRNVENLFSAGRAVGVSHIAFTSVRLMRTGGALGQAAAVAAQICLERNITPRQVATEIPSYFRKRLARNDAFTIGYRDDLEENLVRDATVTASSEASLADGVEDAEFISAHDGVGTWLCQYPCRPEQIGIYVRNRDTSPKKLALSAYYGESKPVELFRVPEIAFDPVRRRYVESDAACKATSAEAGESIPDGKEGVSTYFLRDDKPVVQRCLGAREMMVPAGYEGWMTLELDGGCELKSFDRNIATQALGIKAAGDVLVAAWKQAQDVCLAMEKDRRQAVVRVAPDIALGNARNLLDGFIHREGRAHTHQWRSKKGEPMPQWVRFDFPQPVTARVLNLHFDVTEESYWQMSYILFEQGCRFLPRNFEVQLLKDGVWETAFCAENNCLRFFRHAFDTPQTFSAIKLTVDSLWKEGEQARLYHVGLYR